VGLYVLLQSELYFCVTTQVSDWTFEPLLCIFHISEVFMAPMPQAIGFVTASKSHSTILISLSGGRCDGGTVL
jgi:hypothetical protein